MRNLALPAVALLALGAGCARSADVAPVASPVAVNATTTASATVPVPTHSVVPPVDGYAERRTFKQFGEYIQDRFRGYHVGDDIEFVDVKDRIQVRAIAEGTVRLAKRVSGYGGAIIVQHLIDGKKINAIYGHVSLGGGLLRVGDKVKRGQVLADLGEHRSRETDGERKHLHFALYEGDELRVSGYEPRAEGVRRWINPQDFFAAQGVALVAASRRFDPARDVGGHAFRLSFEIPEGWEVEYVPSIQSLNLFTLAGSGTARERSQMFIRYFDANRFLTLPTVTIHVTKDLTVGAEKYTARRYDIEKKAGVPDFPDQPVWRNGRHVVTDFRGREGYTRYYVVAAHPELDAAVYERVLASMRIVK
jgi:hypothetical protein